MKLLLLLLAVFTELCIFGIAAPSEVADIQTEEELAEAFEDCAESLKGVNPSRYFDASLFCCNVLTTPDFASYFNQTNEFIELCDSSCECTVNEQDGIECRCGVAGSGSVGGFVGASIGIVVLVAAVCFLIDRRQLKSAESLKEEVSGMNHKRASL